MTQDADERALVALLAKALLPEAQGKLTQSEIDTLVAGAAVLSDEERQMLAVFDPLSFLNTAGKASNPLIIFPRAEENLPLAVGFNRGHPDGESAETSRKEVIKKRREIIERISARRSTSRQLDERT